MAKTIVTKSSDGGNLAALRLKLSPTSPAIPCLISAVSYAVACLTIYYHGQRDYIQLIGDPAILAAELRRLADVIQPSSVAARHERQVNNDLSSAPALLSDPVTAWPWLVKRFPWLFDGIELSKEPYASYLQSGDLSLLRPFAGQSLSQADVAEVLFKDRTKTGGSYRRRILAGLAFLEGATTSGALSNSSDLDKIAA